MFGGLEAFGRARRRWESTTLGSLNVPSVHYHANSGLETWQFAFSNLILTSKPNSNPTDDL